MYMFALGDKPFQDYRWYPTTRRYTIW